MRRFLPLLCWAPLLLAGCYGPDREAGDDPTRSDETPGEGRPKTDPMNTVDKPWSGSGTAGDSTSGANADDRGTLDGTSDEQAKPDR
jgi:hypothetical protein